MEEPHVPLAPSRRRLRLLVASALSAVVLLPPLGAPAPAAAAEPIDLRGAWPGGRYVVQAGAAVRMMFTAPATSCGFLTNYFGSLSGAQFAGSINVCVTRGGVSTPVVGSFTATVSPDGSSITGTWSSAHGSGTIREIRLHKIASKHAVLETVNKVYKREIRAKYPTVRSVTLKGKVARIITLEPPPPPLLPPPPDYDPAADVRRGKLKLVRDQAGKVRQVKYTGYGVVYDERSNQITYPLPWGNGSDSVGANG